MSDVNSEITKDVYLVVPAFNEEKTVSQIIEGIAAEGYNVILVNDGSRDKTLDLAIESKRKYPHQIFVVSHVINRGLGAALKTGMVLALEKGAKYIVTFDADGNVENIVPMSEVTATNTLKGGINILKRSFSTWPCVKSWETGSTTFGKDAFFFSTGNVTSWTDADKCASTIADRGVEGRGYLHHQYIALIRHYLLRTHYWQW